MISIAINGKACDAEDGAMILAAAAANGVYIPSLCHHPDLPPFADLPLARRVFRGATAFESAAIACEADCPTDAPQSAVRNPQSVILEGCGLCVVQVKGEAEPVRACRTPVAAGMSILTTGGALEEARRSSLMQILTHHPHACLTCAQREGCSLEDCSSNVPKEERCCWQFHNCELRKVAETVGIKEETPRYRPAGQPILDNEPLLVRDFNLCIDCTRCVRICNQVRGIEALGVVHHDGGLVVGSVAPTLIDSACKFCGACVEVCPTGCLRDREQQTGDRQQWLVPCVGTCPAGVDVPGYIRRIAAGDASGAAALVWEKLPLANVLGYICFHDCECACRRGEVDEPISICALKRFALEAGDGTATIKEAIRPDSGKNLAVIGAGPAGLSAAYFLRLKGHAVTVFEAAETPGGMPTLSVPSYRLPASVLEKDVAAIRALGVEVRTGRRLETGEAMPGLLNEGFDAVLIAVGLPHSRKIPVEGSHHRGVYWGLEFLAAVKEGEAFDLGRRIVVVGGGNVAIDVAMTALRVAGKSQKVKKSKSQNAEAPKRRNAKTPKRQDVQTAAFSRDPQGSAPAARRPDENAETPRRRNARTSEPRNAKLSRRRDVEGSEDLGASVRLFCLEGRGEMPAHGHEIARAEAEGVEVNPGWGPAAIVGEQTGVTGVAFRRCVAAFDERGNFAPRFDEQERMTVEADVVILAIGQAPPEGVPAEREGVFLAGDVAGGAGGGGSVVDAVASGRAAAERIDRYLGGDGDVSIQLVDRAVPSPWIGREEGFAPRGRVPIPCSAPDERYNDFRLIEETYASDAAVAEAARCLQCDLRLMIGQAPLPPERWLELTASNVDQVSAVGGVFLLAGPDKKPTAIKGAQDVQAALVEKLELPGEARFFQWEEDRMYTKRESELIQQHLTQYGELPGGGDDELDDLF